MNVLIVTPAPARSRKGNRVTALRWARILRDLGHRVTILEKYDDRSADLLIALHARKSHASIARFRKIHSEKPLVLALTGTDLYDDIHHDKRAQESLYLADRLIVLQKKGVEELPRELHKKTHVIYQSIPNPKVLLPPKRSVFQVCTVGHLREVKDPFRAAEAARLLPASSRIQIVQLGGALTKDMQRRAEKENRQNPRYRWLGDQPRWKTLRIISRCRLLVLTSKSEGGANVICEALACRTPVLSSRIAGSIGILGSNYPGYFPFGDTRALAELLSRAETDVSFYNRLQSACDKKRFLVEPKHESRSWARLLGDVK